MKRVESWVAEKLKNIYGFNECCTLYFDVEEKEIINTLDGYSESCYYYNSDFNNSENYTIPSVSQVMEWILKKKKLFIDIRTRRNTETKKYQVDFYWILENLENGEISYSCKKLNNSYEEALNNAIEYLIKKDFNYDKY